MTQENKELLLKDLCARLPYGVNVEYTFKVTVIATNAEEIMTRTLFLYSINRLDNMTVSGIDDDGYENICFFEEVKPYLFPLSSMSDEMWDKEFRGCGITEFTRDSFKYGCETLEFNNSNPSLSSMVRFINQLIKNHFDIYGLIPKGLAIDATNLNIYGKRI